MELLGFEYILQWWIIYLQTIYKDIVNAIKKNSDYYNKFLSFWFSFVDWLIPRF